jgi:erythritol kinase
MIAAVCIGLFPDMAACAAQWAGPADGPATPPDAALARAYDALFPIYRDTYLAMPGLWRRLHAAREGIDAGSR